MKKLTSCLFVFVWFGFYFSCIKHVTVRELSLAENLMQEYPDSALLVLQSITSPEKMNNANYATYCLLLTEAQDKNYFEFTSDSVIQVAADYFFAKGDNQSKARTYYMLGRVYHELMHYDKALENYLRAIPLAQKENNYPLLLRTYNQSGELYRNRKIYDRALSSLHEALKYCRLANDRKNLPYCLRDIGRVYLFTGETDSTIYYYQQAIDEARVNYNKQIEHTIYGELAVVYKTQGRYREALKIAKESLETTQEADENNDTALLSLGTLYFHLGHLDSAQYFLEQAQTSKNPYTMSGANYYLYELAVQTGNYKDAVYFNELYLLQKDSLEQLAKTDEVLEIVHRFEQEELKIQKKIKNSLMQRNYLLILIILISLLSVSLIAYYQYRLKKERQISIIQKRLLVGKAYILQKEKEFNLLVEEKNEQSDRFFSQTQYKERIFLIEPNDESENSESSKNSESLNPFSIKEMPELQDALNTYYNDFVLRLQYQYPHLKEREITICSLIKAGARTCHLSKLIHMTPNGVTKKKRQILEKMNVKDKADNLEQFLTEF